MMAPKGLSTTVSNNSKTPKSGNHYSPPTFNKATSKGEITDKDNYHQCNNCDCKKTTKKGAYRDVTVEMPDGNVIQFYHQHPIMVKHDSGDIQISNCGYRTKSTKERINRHLPPAYKVRQEDYTWYLIDPNNDKTEFENGMYIRKENRAAHKL